MALAALFKSSRAQRPAERNPVAALCAELHALVQAECGDRAADYLHRAQKNLEHFGELVEVTDAVHFAVLLQSSSRVLWPCTRPENNTVAFGPAAGDDQLLWAARGVDPADAFRWLEQLLDPRAGPRLLGGTPKPGP